MILRRTTVVEAQKTPPSRRDATPAEAARESAAYKQGRRDERAEIDARVVLQEHDADVRAAYERGRRDALARRPRGTPFLAVVLVLVAAAGALVIYLGVANGSFRRGGQVVDQRIAGTSAAAAGAVHNAADNAGNALEHAGRSLKRSAG